jgi:crotonobetainyl-CoA:carnitine CoA-transferase CaiB-like acyl-CoA transferase
MHRERLNEILENSISKLSLSEAIDKFRSAGVPAARIRDMKSVFELPTANEMILEEKMEDGTLTKRMKTIAFKIG